MDYHKVIFVKKGTYKEKLIMPQWLQNIEICGEDRDQTIITYDDHANIKMDGSFWPKDKTSWCQGRPNWAPSAPSPCAWRAATSR